MLGTVCAALLIVAAILVPFPLIWLGERVRCQWASDPGACHAPTPATQSSCQVQTRLLKSNTSNREEAHNSNDLARRRRSVVCACYTARHRRAESSGPASRPHATTA